MMRKEIQHVTVNATSNDRVVRDGGGVSSQPLLYIVLTPLSSDSSHLSTQILALIFCLGHKWAT
jgi:hypothetical protein